MDNWLGQCAPCGVFWIREDGRGPWSVQQHRVVLDSSVYADVVGLNSLGSGSGVARPQRSRQRWVRYLQQPPAGAKVASAGLPSRTAARLGTGGVAPWLLASREGSTRTRVHHPSPAGAYCSLYSAAMSASWLSNWARSAASAAACGWSGCRRMHRSRWHSAAHLVWHSAQA